jgi:hypothetical protein
MHVHLSNTLEMQFCTTNATKSFKAKRVYLLFNIAQDAIATDVMNATFACTVAAENIAAWHFLRP